MKTLTTTQIQIIWTETDTGEKTARYLIWYWPAGQEKPNTYLRSISGNLINQYAELLISGLTPGQLYNIEVTVGTPQGTVDDNYMRRIIQQRTSKNESLQFSGCLL